MNTPTTPRPETWLVTGGAGFLGLHLVTILQKRLEKVIALDIAPFDPGEYPAETELLNIDTRNRDALASVLREKKVTTVIHAAAALPLAPKRVIYEVNVGGTQNVLETSLAAGVKRVIFVGSTAVYGVPDKHPLVEEDPLVGVGPYGHTKIEGERLCREYRERGLCVPVVRPKTFVGTGRLGVFQILYDWVESGCRIPIIGSGKNRYQLLEVEDLVEAIWLCGTCDPAAANDTFNVGAREFQTVREDIQALCDFAGSGARPLSTPARPIKAALAIFEFLHLSPLYKWVYGTADKDSFVSTERIETQLGWKPRYSNAEALIRSYRWYLDHKAAADAATGVTHRVAWSQGILKVFKWLLR